MASVPSPPPPPPPVVTPAGRFASIGFGTAPVGKHGFIEQVHHPVVHLAQHVISPLTASLFIFGVHKAVQAPAIRAYLRAAWALARHGHKYPPSATAAAAATASAWARSAASSRAVTTAAGRAADATASAGTPATKAWLLPWTVTAVATPPPPPATADSALGVEGQSNAAVGMAGEVDGPVPHPAPLDPEAEAAAAVASAREEADRSAVLMDHLAQMWVPI
jgi:hypothetical protein